MFPSGSAGGVSDPDKWWELVSTAREVAGVVENGAHEHQTPPANATIDEAPMLSIEQCAEYLDVDKKTIYRMMDEGMPYLKPEGNAQDIRTGLAAAGLASDLDITSDITLAKIA